LLLYALPRGALPSPFVRHAHMLYFGNSYLDPDLDFGVKAMINYQAKQLYKRMDSGNEATPAAATAGAPWRWRADQSLAVLPFNQRPRVAVISGSWNTQHPAYRILHPCVESLKRSFPTVLVHLLEAPPTGTDRGVPDPDGYVAIKKMQWSYTDFEQIANDTRWLAEQRFDAIFYPDIGMIMQSVWLANARLAPVQIGGHGHSVSTLGGEIDYWVSGAETEEIWVDGAERLAPEVLRAAPDAVAAAPQQQQQQQQSQPALPVPVTHISQNISKYSETLILLPGLGVIHEKPHWIPKQSRLEALAAADAAAAAAAGGDSSAPREPQIPNPFIINCPWSLVKLNAAQLRRMAQVIAATRTVTRVVFRLFSGGQSYGSVPILRAQLLETLGASHFELPDLLQPDLYLSEFQRGHIFMDSHHHGGCNTVLDALVTATPPILFAAARWNNLNGPAMLRRAGLQRLVARSAEEFVAKVVQFVREPKLWLQTVREISALDFDKLFYETQERTYYGAALHYVLRHHVALQQQSVKPPSPKRLSLLNFTHEVLTEYQIA
jgi:hypothetical protein